MATTDIETITDHEDLAVGNSMEQYKEKPKHLGFIRAWAKQVQDAEDATFGMIDSRTLDLATGAQLDIIGEIVDIARGGLSDDDYRVEIKVKIGKNTSQGGHEKIISIFMLLTGANRVHLTSNHTGSVDIGSEVDIPDESINSVYESIEQIVGGGIRVDHIMCYDETEAFAFEGNTDAPALGFADDAGATGGKFGRVCEKIVPFAFEGDDLGPAGFGSLEDPLVGGMFEDL